MNRKVYYIAISFFAGLAVLLSYFVFPTGQDVAWMFFYDRQFDKSLQEFYEYFGKKEKTRSAVVPKVLLDLEFANTDEAIRTVEGYVRKNPSDLEARVYLGKLYQKVSRPYAYLRNLEEIYELNPQIETLQELKELYEELNESEDQIGALQQLLDEGVATIQDYKDLAELYAARGKMGLALDTIEQMLKKYPPDKVDKETAIFAVNIFNATDQQLEAFLFASNYATEHPQDIETIITFANKMLLAGQPAEAKFLADLVPDSLRGDPNYLELLLTLLIEEEGEQGIYVILEREFKKKNLLPPFYTRLINLAILNKNRELAKEMLEELDFTKVSQVQLILLIDNLIAYREQELANLLEENLGEEYLQQNGLLNLGLTIAELGTSEEIEALVVTEEYDDLERLQISQFLNSSGYRDVAKKLLAGIESLNEVNIELLENIVELYIELGLIDEVDQLVGQYDLKPGFPSALLMKTELMVLAAQGNIEELERRFVLREKLPIQTYVDLFFVAEKTKQKETVMRIAKRLNNLSSTSYNRMLMARALALNGQPAEALKIIRNLQREGVDVRDNYFYTLLLAADQDELYDLELGDFLKKLAQDSSISQTKLREYGYFLTDKNYPEKARVLFEVLAEGKDFYHSDVQTLLFLWGTTPNDEQVDWMVEQAQDRENKDLAGWITYLSFVKHPQEGIQLAEDSGWESPAVAMAYLEALEVAKEQQKMKEVLTVLVDREEDLARLRRMGQMSYDLAIFPTVERAVNKILELAPGDPAAYRLMGFVKYVRAEFHESIYYLRKYVATPDADYLGWYFLSDIYWFFRHWDWSRKYLRVALDLLYQLPERDPYSELIEAQSLYRMWCLTKSKCLYEDLLVKYPKNVANRIDYANVLMVMDQYNRAHYLLETTYPSEDPNLDPELLRREEVNLGLSKVLFNQNVNHLKAAWRLINDMLERYPNDARVILMRANLENRLGRWWNAILWYEEGLRIEPWNEEIQNLQRKIFCEKASFIHMSDEYKLTGAFQTEIISDLIWSHRFNQEYVGKVKASTDRLSLTNALTVFDGLVEDFTGTRARGEVAIERNLRDGTTLELSGFLCREGLGAGLFFEKPDWWGYWRARLWYHRMTWEFTETIIDFGLEDRVEFFRSLNIGPFTELFGRGGYRWYHLHTFGECLQTWTLTAGVNYRLSRSNLIRRAIGDEGAVYFNYYIDAQYPTKEKRVFSPILQTEVTPLDILARETHVVQLSYNKVFCPTFWVEGFGGASWDRIQRGDVGPIAGFIAHFGSKCGPQLNVHWLHTFSSQFENETVDRFIADFKIPY